MYLLSISYNHFFSILIRPEVADLWPIGHLIGMNTADINEISNRTYCSDKQIY